MVLEMDQRGSSRMEERTKETMDAHSLSFSEFFKPATSTSVLFKTDKEDRFMKRISFFALMILVATCRLKRSRR